MSRRVAVTGLAGISPVGNDWPGVRARLGDYRNAVVRMTEWVGYDGLIRCSARRRLILLYPNAIQRKPPGAWAGSL